ncbi:hypothetical protein L210DRAFT_3583525 [Boletus edulis BED1]|uniref:Uncharacterized protein n=1 Tax=Boletus edulis BED1 TaxID=1328754 RepID=A0AAD4BB54_BOLED|nr:hypothetical protein L210DRAFT_3583525 [Boletus edulis BED1]
MWRTTHLASCSWTRALELATILPPRSCLVMTLGPGLLDICTEEHSLGIDVERTSVRPVIDERFEQTPLIHTRVGHHEGQPNASTSVLTMPSSCASTLQDVRADDIRSTALGVISCNS